MSAGPLVSILIPCFNASRWIGQAIDSALTQTWSHREVTVVDDGSTDDSLSVIRRFGDRIRCFSGPNEGGSRARNRLLSHARGEWIQYLDADDYLLPEKISAQLEYVAAHPGADVVYGPVTMRHENRQPPALERLDIPPPHDAWILLARWYLPQTGALLWRRSAVEAVGGWKADQPCCQEHELYLRLLVAGRRFAYHPSGGAVYRQWSDQTVCRRNPGEVHRQRLAIEQRLEEHLQAVGELTPARRHAINQARFEVARGAWHYDRTFARAIMRKAYASEPGFVPESGPPAPGRYRTAMKVFGFAGAQWLADAARFVSGKHIQS